MLSGSFLHRSVATPHPTEVAMHDNASNASTAAARSQFDNQATTDVEVVPPEAPKLAVVTTGGTIAGKAADPTQPTEYKAGASGGDEIVKAFDRPPAYKGQPAKVVLDEAAQIDSKDASVGNLLIPLMRSIKQQMADPNVKGILVTHGSDTLAETSAALHAMFPNPTKPVVLTYSMKPSNAANPDGPKNLNDAQAVAMSESTPPGIYVVGAGKILPAELITKGHPHAVDSFRMVGRPDLGEANPHLGTVGNGKVKWLGSEQDRTQAPAYIQSQGSHPEEVPQFFWADEKNWPQVAWINSHTNVSPRLVELLIEDGKQSGKPLKGIVVGGTGNGTVHENLLPVLQEAQKNGIKVWVSSRATDGVVDRQPGEFPFVKLPPDQALSEMRVMRMADNWLIEQQRIIQENQLD